MNRNEKTDIISEVKEMMQNSTAIFLTDYSGVNVADINDIRNQFRKEGVTYKVYKNTLFKRALDEYGKYDKLADHLIGMTGFAFTDENPVAPAKIIKKYFDKNKKLSLKACYIEDEFFDGSKLNELAALPSKNDLIAGIIGSLEAPVSGIVGTINAVFRDLVSIVDEISKKKAA
ncbi:50S ribosomal protein L10 [bacterium BMS3Abin03]|jgi:large subunit ribosomal protein L10|nr:50S ribosomal protein L10 [bacterium BMS3Abin03]MCG6959496.1 50S ribosomal protein L10 [bacterium BMS3Abin03]